MENLKVNNEYLNNLVEHIEHIVKEINKDISSLKNKDEDIFLRYTAFDRCKALYRFIKPIFLTVQSSMVAGHILQHPIFHTEEGKKNNWDVCKPEHSDFFISQPNNESDDEAEEIYKKKFREVILKAMLKK